MDPDASLPAPAVASPAAAAPTASPKNLQLSPLPGNNYERDHVYYPPFADITQRGFVALLAFAI